MREFSLDTTEAVGKQMTRPSPSQPTLLTKESMMTRDEVLEAIRAAGRKGSRLELMKIVSAHPIDHATALEAFNEGQKEAGQAAVSENDEQET